MPFGKSFHFYAIWELCHLGSYPQNKIFGKRLIKSGIASIEN